MKVEWFLFFFQAEDGIRDVAVTGVQTCALPISGRFVSQHVLRMPAYAVMRFWLEICSTRSTIARRRDRKSTRLNSSHGYISYAVFCLKKKKKYNLLTSSVSILKQAPIIRDCERQ